MSKQKLFYEYNVFAAVSVFHITQKRENIWFHRSEKGQLARRQAWQLEDWLYPEVFMTKNK